MSINIDHFPSEISNLLVLPFSEKYNKNKKNQNLIFQPEQNLPKAHLLSGIHVMAFSCEKRHYPLFYAVVCNFPEKSLPLTL